MLGILRSGQQQDVRVNLRAPKRLIPVHINNRPPSYFITAGLVFTPVTVPFLKSEYGKVCRRGRRAWQVGTLYI